METLFELKNALREISQRMSTDWIPLRVNGELIESVALTDSYEVEVKTKKTSRDKEGIAWIARDENRDIFLYGTKPSKTKSQWNTEDFSTIVELDEAELPEELRKVSWSDNEPLEVKVKISLLV